jgi:hypothetical protein
MTMKGVTTPFPGSWRVFPHPASGDHIVTAGASARKSRSILQSLSLLLGPLRQMGAKRLEVLNEALSYARHVAVHEIE